MQIILIVIGALVGLWLADVSDDILGLAAGAAIVFLAIQVLGLKRQLGRLDERISRLISDRPRRTAETWPAALEGEPAEAPAERPTPEMPPVTVERKAERPAGEVRRADTETERKPYAGPASIEKLVAVARRWLTTGNVPVKIGVIVSFFGVGFLLKYAVDNRILILAIELRLLAVAVAGAALLGIGWRLRSKARVYALSLQGGGIGVLFLTIFSAFRLYDLLPASVAFVVLVFLTAAAGVLAILQEARALAILGSIGGFLAPVLVSAETGNHVALFSYYLVLNAAVLGIAWYRAWRSLNLIGFAFTFGVGTFWGYEYYRPELLASTEPFLVLYFLFYQAIAILFAFRQPPNLRGLVDGTIIFGTPTITFALQTQLLDNTQYGLAISAAAMAAFYVVVATWLRRRHGDPMRLLSESFIWLAVVFGTIAIPLALDDRWTAGAWALEGLALIWVGVRQRGVLAKLGGSAVLIASGVAYLEYGWDSDLGIPVLNGNVLGGVLISAATLVSARLLAADTQGTRWQPLISVALLLWGLGWWIGTGSMEIADRVTGDADLHLLVTFYAASAALLAWVAKYYEWTAARRCTLTYLPAIPVLGLLYLLAHEHFLVDIGTLVWAIAFAAHFYLLYAYDVGRSRVVVGWHYVGLLLLAGVLAYEVGWRIDQASFSDVWAVSGALLVPAATTLAVILLRNNVAWPLQRYWGTYLVVAATLIAMQLFMVGGIGIDGPGDPAPMTYIPVLNPFDVVTVVGLVIALYCLSMVRESTDWLRPRQFRIAAALWAAAAFVLTTIGVIRGVHHLAGVPWNDRALTDSVSVQSALSIYWALLAFGGMIWGTRQSDRWIWIGGTGLMGLVVLKLFVVDLGNTGTVARIVSFLGVGALLLVVGYFSPAPPRRQE